jgi:hypothetical protein
MSIYVISERNVQPNTGESLQDYPLAAWLAQNLTRTFNCTLRICSLSLKFSLTPSSLDDSGAMVEAA